MSTAPVVVGVRLRTSVGCRIPVGASRQARRWSRCRSSGRDVRRDGDQAVTPLRGCEAGRMGVEVTAVAQPLDFAAIADHTLADAPFGTSRPAGPRLLRSMSVEVDLAGTRRYRSDAGRDGDDRATGARRRVGAGPDRARSRRPGRLRLSRTVPVRRSSRSPRRPGPGPSALPDRTSVTRRSRSRRLRWRSFRAVVLTSTTWPSARSPGVVSRGRRLAQTTASLTVVAVGTCAVAQSQAGDAGRLATTPVSRSFAIARRPRPCRSRDRSGHLS